MVVTPFLTRVFNWIKWFQYTLWNLFGGSMQMLGLKPNEVKFVAGFRM